MRWVDRSRAVRAGIAVVLVLAVVGCDWSQVGGGAARRAYNATEPGLTTESVAGYDELWRVAFAGTPGEPLVIGGRVYATVSSGSTIGATVTAIDAASGVPAWSQQVGPTPNVRAAVDEMVGVDDQLLTSWRSHSTVPVGSTYEHVCTYGETRLDLSTGEVEEETPHSDRWSGYALTGSALLGAARPMVTGCSTFYGYNLVVRDAATGQVRWSRTRPAPYPEQSDVAALAATDRMVFVTADGRLEAFRLDGCGAESCPPIWTAIPGSAHPTIVVGENAVLAAGPSALYAFDPATGTRLWRAEDGTIDSNSSAAYASGTVFVADGEALHAFDESGCGGPDCRPVWSAPLSAGGGHLPVSAIAAGGDLVFVGESQSHGQGSIEAFARSGCGSATCQPVWSRQIDGPVTSLSIAGGRIYAAIGTSPGAVVAFGPVE